MSNRMLRTGRRGRCRKNVLGMIDTIAISEGKFVTESVKNVPVNRPSGLNRRQ